jgi:dipeptidyl aminopeptidase/acylaminoacyl peptidase
MPGMLPQDVFQLSGVADPRLSPDGTTVAYVVSGLDGETNEYRGAIWLAALDGSSPPRQLTAGTRRDVDPRWSPDGSRLAFTSNRAGDTMQLYVLPVGGGEPRRLTDLKEDVTQAAWSPDGTTIAFVSRVRDSAYDEEDDKRRAPRRFARLQYKLEHVGWTADRPMHLFTVPADGAGEPVQITSGDAEDASPAWSPDGRTLAFVSARHADWDTEPVNDVYLVDAVDGDDEPLRLTQGGGGVELPSWSPQGDRLAVLRYPGVFDDPRHTQVAVIDAESGDIKMLTQELDRNCGTYPNMREPIWDGDELVFIAEDRGNVHLYRVAADGSGKPGLLVGGEREVTGYDVVAGRFAFATTEPTMAPEISVLEDVEEVTELTATAEPNSPARQVPRRLTHVGDAFAAGRELVAPERFTATSPDGTEVDAWVMKPAGAMRGVKYPMLLNIHGGPFTQYGNRLFDEFQVEAGRGYAVVFSNPRGSSGYSEEWGRAIRGPGPGGPGWGSVDYDDCMAVVDEALRRFDFIDPERLGVIGGSYGGYMTSWIVGHTDRFKAAVSERAVNSFVSMWGSSDFGWDMKGYFGNFLYEDVETYLKVSPLTYAQNIHTPLLILHSENDLRCPIEQGEQLFVTLRTLKRPVEMVRFPVESHELTRSGSPVHRAQRFELVLEWFDRYLKD